MCAGDVFDKKYAYARILLDESSRPEFNLLGLLELYKLLNSDESRKRLETVYVHPCRFHRLTESVTCSESSGMTAISTVRCSMTAAALCDENTCVQDSYVLQDGTFGVRFARRNTRRSRRCGLTRTRATSAATVI